VRKKKYLGFALLANGCRPLSWPGCEHWVPANKLFSTLVYSLALALSAVVARLVVGNAGVKEHIAFMPFSAC